MESSLRSAVRENLGMLDVVSRERIGMEMERILGGRNAGEVILQMHEDGVLNHILPGIDCTVSPSFCTNFLVNLALLCSGDSSEGSALAGNLRSALMMAKEPLRQVAFLHGARDTSVPTEIGGLRRFRAALPPEWQDAFIAYSHGLGRETSEFVEALASLSPLIVGNAPLIDGNTLAAATGLNPGPRMGRLKGLLHRIQIERDLPTAERVLSLLDDLDWIDSDYEEWPALSWP
tara:strand:- start:3590 stop:4288 length:699 start_codon:yes stop_codon:yes gene_type:complete